MSNDPVPVKMRMGDFLDRGGKVYSEVINEGGESQALIDTLTKAQKEPV
ncbi:AvrPphF family type III effector [Pseudomonas syringae group genomosp. 7]